MKELIPWWARIGAKLVLSRLPVGYGLWRKLNLFAHGAMHHADYALCVFQEHFERSQIPAGQGFAALELGPGDALSSAVIAAAHGATHTYLVDAGQFATSDLSVYRNTAHHLQARGLTPPDLEKAHNVNAVLRICRASYGTRGLESMQEIPSASVDFIWSQAVLEHVRRHELLALMRETRRVIRDDGVCSHTVDLQDDLGGALNNLRIPSRWWEAEWMARSGFYTNRLRMSELVRIFESAGFIVNVVAIMRWEAMPMRRSALAQEFQGFDEEDLLVKGIRVILRPASSHRAP